MTDFLQMQTTFERQVDAERLATALLERRLAACVQIIGPIQSTYRWQGKVETAEEWLCLVKTRRNLYDEVERAIIELHPYQTPEIIAVPIIAGSRAYLDWVAAETEGR
jgi:periplasmic divalent cation tolerance protein